MSRKKLPEDKKKKKFSITVDERLTDILEKHIEEKMLNKSRYIEDLIRKDMESRGENIEREF